MSDLVKKFWDLYEEHGIEEAVIYAQNESNGSLEALKEQVSELIIQAQERDIDVISFLEQLEEVEARDADRTTDNADLLPVDSGASDAPAEDADEPAESADDACEAGDRAEETAAG